MKNIGYGSEYKYAHQYDGNFVNLEFLPEKINGIKFYDPGHNAREHEAREKLRKNWGEKYSY
jgi:putative ATPase